jgi:hypothetical protein
MHVTTDLISLAAPDTFFMSRDIETVGPLSQAAVASFVFGVIQATITMGYTFIMVALSRLASALPPSVTDSTSIGSNPNALLVFLLLNVWGIFAVLTGIGAIIATHRGKSGDALGTIGLLLGIGCMIVTVALSIKGV